MKKLMTFGVVSVIVALAASLAIADRGIARLDVVSALRER